MPLGSGNTEDLQEPVDLRSRLSTKHPLDWGEPLPSAAQLVAEFGRQATQAALSQVAALDTVADQATSQVVVSTMPGASLYQLDHRIKSPQSLARKLHARMQATAAPPREVEDLVRYTVLAPHLDELVAAVKYTVNELAARDWQVRAVRNSYVDGSRYKGLHLDWREPGGQRIEVQVHTPQSVAIKEATTRLYEVERDIRLPRAEREAARAACVRLSAALETPPGLDELTSLGGCQVYVRGYGLARRARERDVSPGRPDRSRPPGNDQRKVANDGMDR